MGVNRKEKRGERWGVRREVIKFSSHLEMAGKLTDCREMKIFHDTRKICMRAKGTTGWKESHRLM